MGQARMKSEFDAITVPKPIDEETLDKLANLRTTVQSAFGQVVLAMCGLPRYRHQSLADLAHLVIDPLARDRISIATPVSSEGADPVAAPVLTPPAIAIWASVSEAVGKKIEEQIMAGSFPIRLKPGDWNSGEQIWLLDVIAPTRKIATTALTNFRRVAKQESIRIHPLIAGLVDPGILAELRGGIEAEHGNAAGERARSH